MCIHLPSVFRTVYIHHNCSYKYQFTSISFGIGTDEFETLVSKWALRVRKNGQGKSGHKKPVLFPKLTFLYDEELHGAGKSLEWLFNEAIECSKQAMYPDFLSLSGDGYIPSMYKKYIIYPYTGKDIMVLGNTQLELII